LFYPSTAARAIFGSVCEYGGWPHTMSDDNYSAVSKDTLLSTSIHNIELDLGLVSR
jgi:hypothetical protein